MRVTGDKRRPEAPGGRVHERVGHGETMSERHVGGLQRERFVHGRDGRAAQRRGCFRGALFAEVRADHLVDLVDLDGGDEKRLTPLEVRREPTRLRSVSQVLDPAARIDKDQRRSFFSRSALVRTPRTMPR